jgi:hypothetical protein
MWDYTDIWDVPTATECCTGPDIFDAAQQPAPTTDVVFGPTPTTDVTLPDPYADLEALVQMHPEPTQPAPALDPTYLLSPILPTFADVQSSIDTITTNIIDPYPGYTADYNDVTNEVEWEPDI